MTRYPGPSPAGDLQRRRRGHVQPQLPAEFVGRREPGEPPVEPEREHGAAGCFKTLDGLLEDC